MVKTAQQIIGVALLPISGIYTKGCRSRAHIIISDLIHPNHHLFTPPYNQVGGSWLTNSFFPTAVKLLPPIHQSTMQRTRLALYFGLSCLICCSITKTDVQAFRCAVRIQGSGQSWTEFNWQHGLLAHDKWVQRVSIFLRLHPFLHVLLTHMSCSGLQHTLISSMLPLMFRWWHCVRFMLLKACYRMFRLLHQVTYKLQKVRPRCWRWSWFSSHSSAGMPSSYLDYLLLREATCQKHMEQAWNGLC